MPFPRQMSNYPMFPVFPNKWSSYRTDAWSDSKWYISFWLHPLNIYDVLLTEPSVHCCGRCQTKITHTCQPLKTTKCNHWRWRPKGRSIIIQLWSLGERCKLPQWGLGRSPSWLLFRRILRFTEGLQWVWLRKFFVSKYRRRASI